MRASTLKRSSYTWTEIPIYDTAEARITTATTLSPQYLEINNGSGSARAFSINSGPPFLLAAGIGKIIDLGANGIPSGSLKIETDTSTLTSIDAWAW